MVDERHVKPNNTEENSDADAARDSSLSQDLATSLVMVLQKAMASQYQRDTLTLMLFFSAGKYAVKITIGINLACINLAK